MGFFWICAVLLQMRAFGSVSSATIEVVFLCSVFVGTLFAVVFGVLRIYLAATV